MGWGGGCYRRPVCPHHHASSPPAGSSLTVFSPSTTTQLRARTTWVTIACFPASFPARTWTCGGGRGVKGRPPQPSPCPWGGLGRGDAYRIAPKHLPVLLGNGLHEDLAASQPGGVAALGGGGVGAPGAVPVTGGQPQPPRAQQGREAHGGAGAGGGRETRVRGALRPPGAPSCAPQGDEPRMGGTGPRPPAEAPSPRSPPPPPASLAPLDGRGCDAVRAGTRSPAVRRRRACWEL